ncbi:MAG TPA: hypothetical protein VJ597_06610 [Sphingomicrobium sp.]|nr:hypothetical protein [Sphingomicrobium sp.]
MRFRLLIAIALGAMPAAVQAMPVAAFLTKADALQRKGPMALFSSDLKLLTNQIKRDAGELRAENKAAEAAGRRKSYCAPTGGVKLTNRDILGAMHAVPPPKRATTQTKDALRAYFARRFPCPR